MRITSSYGVEILGQHKLPRQTMQICRKAVCYLMPVIDREWENLSRIPGQKKRFNTAEKLIHTTRQNKAVYGFDEAFPKMPSYLRRAILQHVIGTVSSAKTRGERLQSGERGREKTDHYMPVFYKDNMYKRQDDHVYLKLYSGRDWIWQEVQLKKTDLDYLRKNWSDVDARSPVLVKRHRKYFLQFAFEQQVSLSQKKAQERRICAVDLGINTDAVCSIMTADGTVAARKFISFPAEKDHLWHVLGRIKRMQREHGSLYARGLWAYAGRLNSEIARKTAGAVTAFADAHKADVIVFEHLDMRGAGWRKSRQKLHMWKKQEVQKIVEHHAHRAGIRVSHVNARKTSALAYDGSGPLERDPGNHALSTFSSGKQYNCDLSASYNIGARYYIRELLKPASETERSALEAKVPAVQRRTSCVYADLLELRKAMAGAV